MPEQISRPPQIEVLKPEEAPLPMSGDSIIANPDVAYDTSVIVPLSIEEVWSGRLGITRMGPLDENGAGLPTPPRLDKYFRGEKIRGFRSLPDDAPIPRQLEVGDSMPDGHKDDRAVLVERDDEARSMVFDMQWTPKPGKVDALHYTWQLWLTEGETPGTTILTARTRMENISHPEIWAKYAPRADQMAMRVIAEGITRDDPAFEATGQRSPHRLRRAVIGGVAAAVAARQVSKHSDHRAIRVVTPIAGAAIGAVVGTKTASKKRTG